MEKNRKMRLYEVISEIKKNYLQYGADALLAHEDWYLYTADDVLTRETACLIADPVDVDAETFDEVLPEAAVQNDMLNPLSCEILNDVVFHAMSRNESVSVSMLVDALNYYLENDSFLCV